ncbi:nucleoside deaminase [Parasulfuritortus cantonensis]|uniref:Nucleoside deaminase n=2 Tax=Parasulfuritortus cantonensis TaxID=2528202 RepID=A0A4R1BH03_9PROT|nr:nucleoside deaminase [Parasulfuritortus cantonensis]
MALAVELARENVERASGGPFGAAIFSLDQGRLLAVGVNSVVRLNSSVLHAEMLAIMRAQRALGRYTLNRAPGYALYTSCEPCAMCLGGILWSGVRRLVCAAPAAAARQAGFDEGPVDAASYAALERAGIEVRRGVLAEPASAVIARYRALGRPIYNP